MWMRVRVGERLWGVGLDGVGVGGLGERVWGVSERVWRVGGVGLVWEELGGGL